MQSAEARSDDRKFFRFTTHLNNIVFVLWTWTIVFTWRWRNELFNVAPTTFNIRSFFVTGIHFRGYKKTVSKGRKLEKRRLTDEKKNAASVVQKIRRKTLVDREINKVELNVGKLLNLSRSNTIREKLENKVIHYFYSSRYRYLIYIQDHINSV